ncbi:hypothetical protein EC973_008780, partial [Apophysomyces ossiformis]
VRTKFHRASTYLRCRSFNEFTNDIVSRPFTIFTLADSDIGYGIAQYRIGSQLFQSVAHAIFTGVQTLAKTRVQSLASKLPADSTMARHFNAIEAL